MKICREAFSGVLGKWGNKAAEHLGSLRAVQLYPDQTALSSATSGSGVQGFYRSSKDDDQGELHLTGHGVADVVGTYAHEMAHAVDHHHRYSKTQKWRRAWREEIGDQQKERIYTVAIGGTAKRLAGKEYKDVKAGERVYWNDGERTVENVRLVRQGRMGNVVRVKMEEWESARHYAPSVPFFPVGSEEAPPPRLSQYATTRASEGFAEFGRLLVDNPKRAEKEFPKCFKAWRDWDLV